MTIAILALGSGALSPSQNTRSNLPRQQAQQKPCSPRRRKKSDLGYGTTQAPERSDILNVGGFSDAVFKVVSAFLRDEPGRFVSEVEAVEL